jgi:hypothetical protein
VTDVTVRETFADGQRVLDPDSDTGSFETDFPRLTSNGVPVTIAKAVSADGVITLTARPGRPRSSPSRCSPTALTGSGSRVRWTIRT